MKQVIVLITILSLVFTQMPMISVTPEGVTINTPTETMTVNTLTGATTINTPKQTVDVFVPYFPDTASEIKKPQVPTHSEMKGPSASEYTHKNQQSDKTTQKQLTDTNGVDHKNKNKQPYPSYPYGNPGNNLNEEEIQELFGEIYGLVLAAMIIGSLIAFGIGGYFMFKCIQKKRISDQVKNQMNMKRYNYANALGMTSFELNNDPRLNQVIHV